MTNAVSISIDIRADDTIRHVIAFAYGLLCNRACTYRRDRK